MVIITFGTDDTIEHKRDVLQNLSDERIAVRYNGEARILSPTCAVTAVLETELWLDAGRDTEIRAYRIGIEGITSIEVEI